MLKFSLFENEVKWAPLLFTICLVIGCYNHLEKTLPSASNTPITVELRPNNEQNVRKAEFLVPDSADGWLDIQLNGPLHNARIILIHSTKKVTYDSDDEEVTFIKKEFRSRSQHGDMIQLPNIRSPAAGHWTLKVLQKVAQQGSVKATISYFDRYQFHIIPNTNEQALSGQTVPVQLILTEYGLPLRGLRPAVSVAHQDVVLESHSATPVLSSSSALKANDDPGSYWFEFTPPEPGEYTVSASVDIENHKDTVTLYSDVVTIQVHPQPVELISLHLLKDTANDCQNNVIIALEFKVKKNGDYSYTALFKGKGVNDVEKSFSSKSHNGSLKFKLNLSLNDLHKMEVDKVEAIAAFELLYFGATRIELVNRKMDVPLPQPIDAALFCK